MQFTDRGDAGKRLGSLLTALTSEDAVVLGLPRGGVPVAGEVARALHAPLDIIVVRKLGVPSQPELAMGAIGEGGVRVLNAEILRMAGIRHEDLAEVERRECEELERRARQFRGDRVAVPLTGRTVIIVDDGIATGATARSACRVTRARGAARVILAMPVGPVGIEADMHPEADQVICLHTARDFGGIGRFYRDFIQTTDREVIQTLRRAAEESVRR